MGLRISLPPAKTERDDRDTRRTAHNPGEDSKPSSSAYAECVPKQPRSKVAVQVSAMFAGGL
jgi:hypothetical protein